MEHQMKIGKKKKKKKVTTHIHHNTSLLMIPSHQHASTLHASFSLVAPGPYHEPQPWYQDHPQHSVVAVARYLKVPPNRPHSRPASKEVQFSSLAELTMALHQDYPQRSVVAVAR
jgi:hypothetical protein